MVCLPALLYVLYLWPEGDVDDGDTGGRGSLVMLVRETVSSENVRS